MNLPHENTSGKLPEKKEQPGQIKWVNFQLTIDDLFFCG
jgi:hypothetical protein